MLDTQGLIALWREGLGAQKALVYLEHGMKLGYQNHPQLQRFKDSENPVAAMSKYMWGIYSESLARGYKFNATLLLKSEPFLGTIPVTSGQVEYEHEWLSEKLTRRAPHELPRLETVVLHPLFHEVDGDIEAWEKIPS